MMFPARATLDLLARLKGRRIVVVGDLIADEYLYGKPARISREAPVLILRFTEREVRLGGAANAAHNVQALGAHAVPVGVVGDDEAGREIEALFERAGIATDGVVRAEGRRTPVKTRIMAGGYESTRQQVVRLDREPEPVLAAGRGGAAARAAGRARPGCRRIRRCRTTATARLSPRVFEPARELARARGAPVSVDSRYDLLRFRGATAATPNEPEVEALTGAELADERAIEKAGRQVLERLEARLLLVTRGSRGMALFERDGPVTFIPIHGSDQIADVTGRGGHRDQRLHRRPRRGRSRRARRLARQRRGRRGRDEARDRERDARRSRSGARSEPASDGAVLGPEEAARWASTQRGRARRSSSPTAASTSSTWATCAIWPPPARWATCWWWRSTRDASVRRLKGAGRPLMPAAERAELRGRARRRRRSGGLRGGHGGRAGAPAAARRAGQGHRLHARTACPERADRARGGRARGHRRRSQGPLDPRPHRRTIVGVSEATGDRAHAPERPRIAIVKLSSLGDVIHALPVARALRRARPQAHITWIVEAREHAILRDHPDIDRVIPVDTRRWRRLDAAAGRRARGLGQARAAAPARAAGRLRGRARPPGAPQERAPHRATRARRVRIGFAPPALPRAGCVLFTNRRVTPPPGAVHVVDQYLALLGPLGIPARPARVPSARVGRRRRGGWTTSSLRPGFKPGDRVVALNPGAGRPEKQWPVEHFRALAERLGTEADARVLLLWGPGELEMAQGDRRPA